MCKWSMMQNAAAARKAESEALIRAALNGEVAVTRAPMGMRKVTPSNMERLVRGVAVAADSAESEAA